MCKTIAFINTGARGTMKTSMLLFLTSTVLVFTCQNAIAAHYSFYQPSYENFFVKGSFNTSKTSGTVTNDQIENFRIYFSEDFFKFYPNDPSTSLDIVFNINTHFLSVEYNNNQRSQISPFMWHSNIQSFKANNLGGMLINVACFTDDSSDYDCSNGYGFGSLPNYSFNSSEPLKVTQTPIPGALGFFSVGVALISLLRRKLEN
jgi:hypothetical protein